MPKDIILFESYPYFSGNPLELFRELLRRGYGNNYCMMWTVACDDSHKYKFPTIPYIGANEQYKKSILQSTKLIIDSNQFIHKVPGVYRIHTRHGCGFKRCQGYYNNIGDVDAIITTSDDMKRVDEQSWPSYCKSKFIITGLPSNDRLFHPNKQNLHLLLQSMGYEQFPSKLVAWLPTYRQHRWSNQLTNHKYPYGLPLIQTSDEFTRLNQYLASNDIVLLIQMHHAQSNNYHQLPNMSNVKFVRQSLKDKFAVTTADILGASDALITDYSSAYHEYIILNRPIALTIDDFNEYSKSVGFLYDYHDWISGHPCNRLANLYDFLDNVLGGVDPYINDRLRSLRKIHKYIDDQSTNRVIDFLEQKHVITKG